MIRILDGGPLPYPSIEVSGENDVEFVLAAEGLDPSGTLWRLIEIPLAAIDATQTFPRPANTLNAWVVDSISNGVELPPIVVQPASKGWCCSTGSAELMLIGLLADERSSRTNCSETTSLRILARFRYGPEPAVLASMSLRRSLRLYVRRYAGLHACLYARPYTCTR